MKKTIYFIGWMIFAASNPFISKAATLMMELTETQHLFLHSKSVLKATTDAQGYDVENIDFDMQKLSSHAMNTMHQKLVNLAFVECVQQWKYFLLNEKKNYETDVKRVLEIKNSMRILDKSLFYIDNFLEQYPKLQDLQSKKKISQECIQSLIDINAQTFSYWYYGSIKM